MDSRGQRSEQCPRPGHHSPPVRIPASAKNLPAPSKRRGWGKHLSPKAVAPRPRRVGPTHTACPLRRAPRQGRAPRRGRAPTGAALHAGAARGRLTAPTRPRPALPCAPRPGSPPPCTPASRAPRPALSRPPAAGPWFWPAAPSRRPARGKGHF